MIPSSSGGGGGGSGGSVKLSSCTLTAGSGASIEAKGGNGGQARSRGENDLVYRCFISMYITNLSTSCTFSLNLQLAMVEAAEEEGWSSLFLIQ